MKVLPMDEWFQTCRVTKPVFKKHPKAWLGLCGARLGSNSSLGTGKIALRGGTSSDIFTPGRCRNDPGPSPKLVCLPWIPGLDVPLFSAESLRPVRGLSLETTWP